MADKENNNNLNEISNSLINMHVSDLLNRYNISKESKKLRELSSDEKSKLKESVGNLKQQVEAFLEDQQNKNNNFSNESTQALTNQLQNLKRRSNNK
ncbi:hypothetical protein NC661_11980 [Aquibacillus koreensis]|uniref:Spore coat protein n=1 Tax=Aquibacillus koreensis TaxID=279446 RepID=A0A9X4AK67_9BACI|nr:hypothetical protein [Aquibacillus koreensis]MCT2535229.1 hypothetical protein [Aquibacillus koreensis]MDC3421088.1 hypothetical protein [Aquibacillus koreensis]